MEFVGRGKGFSDNRPDRQRSPGPSPLPDAPSR
jgi:hypothetical protein